jgi:hypothetical protein
MAADTISSAQIMPKRFGCPAGDPYIDGSALRREQAFV